MIESWIVEKRRKTCGQCAEKDACNAAGIIHSIFAEVSKCPQGKHPSRIDEIAARAWPDGVPAVSGCCDRMG